MNTKAEKLEAFGQLLDIVDELREKCPWDRKQTFETLRHLTIEETYELGDAILENNLDEVKKELGDLLLHIVFYARLGSEKAAFDVADVAQDIAKKLIHRHPHIYGDVTASSAEEVKQNWEHLKLKEGKRSVLGGVPKGLPALVKAHRIQDKVASVGFDWKRTNDVWSKVKEEIEELHHEVQVGDKKSIENEFGDVLFSLVNYARFISVNPETALERTNKKFITRFQFVEQSAEKQQKKLSEMPLEEMEKLWQSSKTNYLSSEDSEGSS